MATENENVDTGTETQAKPEPKIVGIGKPVLVNRTEPATEAKKEAVAATTTGGTQNTGAEGDGKGAQASGSSTTTEPSEEQIKAFFEKNNIKWTGLDDARAKLADKQESKPEPTEEEKKTLASARDKRRLDKYLQSGGTIEQYAAIKAVAEKDVKELSQSETRRELKDAGFSDDQIEGIIKERYYQISEDDLEMLENETDKEFAKRKRDFFSGKLASRASHLHDKAKQVISNLDADLDAEDSLVQRENEISSKVEEHFSTFPREMTFELGEIDGQTIDPIKYNVNDAEISQALETLKSPEKRKQFLYNEDGSLNIASISEALIAKTVLSNLVKTSALEGGTREVKKFEAVFPKNAHALGVNGGSAATETNGKKTGQLVGHGKPQVVKR